MLKLLIVSFVCLLVLSNSRIFGLKCYDCSSQSNPKCADPFISGNEFLIDCPEAPEHIIHLVNQTTARYCRKLKQLIDGKRQVTFRSCGYLINNDTTKENKICFKDAFSSFSSSVYCDCSGDACNTTEKLRLNKFLFATLLVIISFITVSR